MSVLRVAVFIVGMFLQAAIGLIFVFDIYKRKERYEAEGWLTLAGILLFSVILEGAALNG